MPPTHVKISLAHCQDFVVLPISDIAPHSKMVEAVSTLSADEDTLNITVDIESCKPTKATLEALIEYIALIRSQAPSVVRQASNDITALVSQTELAFLSRQVQHDDREEMKRLLQLGCFLQMESLRNLTAAWWACGITKIVEEHADHDECVARLREFVGVENDWSQEELAVLREQAKWAQ